MAGAPAREASWVTCKLCGDAVPPGGVPCPTCGKETPADPSSAPPLSRGKQRRFRFVQVARSFIVVVVVFGIAYAIISAVVTGPPTFSDPLTGQGTYTVAPGNFTYVSGAITGEDYVEGNYTVMTPPGALVVFTVYNSSEFLDFARHLPTSSQWSVTGQSSGRIVFAAPYTDTFYFVFANPYPTNSGLGMDLYIVTEYQSNVVIG